jgi:hypothetical protein
MSVRMPIGMRLRRRQMPARRARAGPSVGRRVEVGSGGMKDRGSEKERDEEDGRDEDVGVAE